jgi:spore germination protein YaaH
MSTKNRFLLILAALALGMALVIASQPARAADSCKATYTVRSGDTPAAIADKYDVAFEAFTKANRLYSPYYTIYVNQALCIPATSKVYNGSPNSATAQAADYTARLNGKNVEISTSNFPKKNSYYVKVGPAGSTAGTKVGQLNTGSSGGSLKGSYPLPKNLQSATQTTVCMKNNTTDANVCRTAKR